MMMTPKEKLTLGRSTLEARQKCIRATALAESNYRQRRLATAQTLSSFPILLLIIQFAVETAVCYMFMY